MTSRADLIAAGLAGLNDVLGSSSDEEEVNNMTSRQPASSSVAAATPEDDGVHANRFRVG
jgi:hypothetical protein